MQRVPATPAVVPTTVEELLAAARATLRRLAPREAHVAVRDGAQLVDIRSDSQRSVDGTIPGAVRLPATCSSGGSIRPARIATTS